jgi:CRP-like cAMP-binding protein
MDQTHHFSLFFISDVIGNFDSIIALLTDHQKEYASRINFVSQFMVQHSVSPATQAKVNSYYNYLWAANDGKDISDTMALLPDSLRSEVSVFLLRSLVERVSFFKKAEPGFISSVIAMLEPFIAVPGQFIMRAGDVGTAMYFLQKGEAEVLVGPSELKVSKLESGDYFGEMAVLFLAPRSASIRAVTYCELFQLSKTNLEHVMNMYPEQAQFIMEEAALKKKLTVLRSTTIKKQGTQDVALPTMRRQRTSANSANDLQAAATLVNINSLMRAPSSMAHASLSAEGSDSESEDFLPPPRKPAESSPSPSPSPPSPEPIQEPVAASVPGTIDTVDVDSDVGSDAMSDVDIMSAEEMAGADDLPSGDRRSSNGRRMSVIAGNSSVEEISGANFSDAVFVEGITKWLKYEL